jgi:hypothetical protein
LINSGWAYYAFDHKKQALDLKKNWRRKDVHLYTTTQ